MDYNDEHSLAMMNDGSPLFQLLCYQRAHDAGMKRVYDFFDERDISWSLPEDKLKQEGKKAFDKFKADILNSANSMLYFKDYMERRLMIKKCREKFMKHPIQ